MSRGAERNVAQDWTDEYRPGYHRLSGTTRWRFSLLSTYIGFFTEGLEEFGGSGEVFLPHTSIISPAPLP